MGFAHSRRLIIAALCTLGLAAGLAGCASPPAGGTFETSSRYDTVFRACVAAAADVGYGVTSADPNSGFISASQAVYSGHGSTVTLSVTVRRENGHVVVEADFVRPPGTITLGGGLSEHFDLFVAAVKRRVPDVTVTLRKS